MTVRQKIEQVLKRRAPMAAHLKQVEVNLEGALAALHALEDFRDEIMPLVNPEVAAQMSGITFEGLRNRMKAERLVLGRMRQRFQRPTLNLGAIGRARQGKSLLLQSLTGLSSREIPDGDRQHCTGVRSTIHNAPVNEPYAEVEFYSERAFIEEVLRPYYSQLNLGSIMDLDSFAGAELPRLDMAKLEGHAEPGAKYRHLRSYRQHLEEYRHLLGQPPRRIEAGQIREYVAQDDERGERRFFRYMAVKEVRIYCSFPHEEIGQVAVVDMPGLGDTGVGDEQRLISSLGQDVDFVLFVRMPKSSGDHWADTDVRLYDVARSSLTELPVERWSMMVLNRTAPGSRFGDNVCLCEDLQGDVANHHLNTTRTAIADCADPDQIARLVLEPVLDHLLEHISNLDREYAWACEERIVRLQTEVRADLARLEGILGQGSAGDSEYSLFQRSFEQIYRALSVGIEGKVRQLRQHRDDEDQRFIQRVHHALEVARADTAPPTPEQVVELRDTQGSYDRALNHHLDRMRTRISEHILTVDDSLQETFEGIKEECAEIFRAQGRLGGVCTDSGARFFQEVRELYMGTDHEKLAFGFSVLGTFSLSFRGFIQHRVRPHLDCLDPDQCDFKLPPRPTVEQVIDLLQAAHDRVFYELEGALAELYAEPSQAAFAIVEEFKDRVLRATGTEEDLSVRDEWRDLYFGLRSDIWPEEFDALGQRTRVRKRWEEALRHAAESCRPELFDFNQD